MTRAVCIVDELVVVPELVDEIEAAERSPRSIASKISVRQGVRELFEHLRLQAELISDVVVRLERVAEWDEFHGNGFGELRMVDAQAGRRDWTAAKSSPLIP